MFTKTAPSEGGDNSNPDENIKALFDEVNQALAKQAEEVKGFVKKTQEDEKANGKALVETKTAMTDAIDKLQTLEKRFTEMKQSVADMQSGIGGAGGTTKSLGTAFTESDAYKSYTGSGNSSKFQMKAAIDDTNANDLIVTDRRPGIQTEPLQPLRIRDLMTVIPTSSSSIEYAREDVFTNNADYQAAQGDAKAESAITFTMATAVIRTIAHWIPMSKQIIADVPALSAHVDGRLRYGLKLKEEAELLNGPGTGVRLSGLMTNATDAGAAGVGVNMMDAVRNAMVTVDAAFYSPTGHVLNPADWAKVEMSKTDDGAYIFANPQNTAQPRLWGLPVVQSHSQTANAFMTGAFAMAAELYDRTSMAVYMSEHHANFFVENMVALLCEERLGMAVRRPAAFVKGTFS